MTEGRRERTFTNLFDPAPVMQRLRGLTDREAGDLLGFNHQTILRWRAGQRLTTENADKVATALGLHPANLWLGWHDNVTKRCPRCKVRLPITFFSTDVSKSDGMRTWCKPCDRAHKQSKKGPQRTPAPCGTNGGYVRHLRAGEEACTPCKAAHATCGGQAWYRANGLPKPRRSKRAVSPRSTQAEEGTVAA
jgi:hypothetical protein